MLEHIYDLTLSSENAGFPCLIPLRMWHKYRFPTYLAEEARARRSERMLQELCERMGKAWDDAAPDPEYTLKYYVPQVDNRFLIWL